MDEGLRWSVRVAPFFCNNTELIKYDDEQKHKDFSVFWFGYLVFVSLLSEEGSMWNCSIVNIVFLEDERSLDVEETTGQEKRSLSVCEVLFFARLHSKF